jgi:hypothetical protein
MRLMLAVIALITLAVPALAEVAEGTLYSSDALYFDLLISSTVSYPRCATMIYRHTDNGTLNYMAMWPANCNSDEAVIATFIAAALTSEQTSWSSNRVYAVIVGDGMYSMATADARYMVSNYDRNGEDWAFSYMLTHATYEGDL